MIAYNELRIGNYMKRDENIEAFEGWMFDAEENVLCNPIPITQAILEQCGLEKEPQIDHWYGDVISLYKCQSDYSVMIFIKDVPYLRAYEVPYYEITKIKYFHQLQNIYFALAGKELEVNIDQLKGGLIDTIQ